MRYEKLRLIVRELREHSPFTIFGALTGIVFMLLFRRFGVEGGHVLFSIFHPLHVFLSAMVTAALFQLHRKAKNFLLILAIGYFGSIGVATISDSVIPFFGESILGAAVPTEAAVHAHVHEDGICSGEHDHDHKPRLHLGFIEEWWLVNPAAILGIVIAYFVPKTKYPHALHVLVSTWASSSHMLMNTHADWSITLLVGMFLALFIAVWLPCCISDIVFPLLFVRADGAHIGHQCILCGRKENPTPSDSSPQSHL
ncbi:MAG: hypothetical protein WHS88_00885 [Anaerohalosphaeraceae bacterium]